MLRSTVELASRSRRVWLREGERNGGLGTSWDVVVPRHEREGVCKLFSPNLPLPRIEARAQVTRSTGRGGEGEKKMKRRRLCASDDNRRLSAIRFFAFDGTPSFPFFASASPNKFNWLSASTDKYFCAEWVRSNKLERRDLTLIFIRYFFFH